MLNELLSELSEKDTANLLAMIDASRKIQLFTQNIENADEFYANEMIYDATLINFVVIGEAASKISTEVRQANKQVDFIKIKNFRNMIAHDYFGVDAEVIWQIIVNNIPTLIVDVKQMLGQK